MKRPKFQAGCCTTIVQGRSAVTQVYVKCVPNPLCKMLRYLVGKGRNNVFLESSFPLSCAAVKTVAAI